MGSPISSLTAEIFLQNYEDKYIKQFLEAKSIIFYARYVDGILIIFDKTKTIPQNINTYINKIHNNLKLTPTHEEHNSINYLDLTIRQHNKFNIDIYRKPTATDTTINFLSNHPIEQIMAAFRSYLNRMHSLHLSQDKKGKPYNS